jgi:hypothetical protein
MSSTTKASRVLRAGAAFVVSCAWAACTGKPAARSENVTRVVRIDHWMLDVHQRSQRSARILSARPVRPESRTSGGYDLNVM